MSMKRSIFYLALPIILENILQTLLGTVDAFFAGKLADAAIAGISVTNLIMNIFISFFTAVSIGSTAVIARRYGEKELRKWLLPSCMLFVQGWFWALVQAVFVLFLAKRF